MLPRARALVLAVGLLGLAGCARRAPPELLDLEAVGPRLLEPGSELVIRGAGFPERRSGVLLLEGTVAAPARQPEVVRWRLPVTAQSGVRASLRLDAERLDSLAGGAAHVTFRGEARVEFPPQRPGGSPLGGRLPGLSLDLVKRRAAASPPPPRRGFASYLGLGLTPDLRVAAVEPGSEAERAGLLVGDRLVELDGLWLLGPEDFLPRAHGLTSTLRLEREGLPGLARVDVARASFQLIDSLSAARAVAGVLALGLALLFAARPPRALVWWAGRSAERGASAALLTGSPRLGASAFAYGALALVVSGLWALVRLRLGGPLELALLLAGGLGAVGLAGLLAGGSGAGRSGGFSLLRGLVGLLWALVGLLPLSLGVLALASERGTLRLIDHARPLGAGAAGVALLTAPWWLCLGALGLLALVPLAGRRSPVEGHARGGLPGGVAAALEWVGQLVLLGLWVMVFLGGTGAEAPGSWQAGALLGGKLLLSLLVLGALRARAGLVRWAEAFAAFSRVSLLGTLVCVGAALLAHRFGWAESQREPLAAFTLVVAAALLVLLVVASLRSLTHQGRRTDPWM